MKRRFMYNWGFRVKISSLPAETIEEESCGGGRLGRENRNNPSNYSPTNIAQLDPTGGGGQERSQFV